VPDIVCGARSHSDGGFRRGAVFVMFMKSDGTVKNTQCISDTHGNFDAILGDSDVFGQSVTELGDLDGDSIPDIAVGCTGDDDGGSSTGAVYILFLERNGTVKDYQKISDYEGNFNANFENYDYFGVRISNLRDVNGDGIQDLAVGAYLDDNGTNSGGVYILFLDRDGTVKDYRLINKEEPLLSDELDAGDVFGRGVTYIGDINIDGNHEIAVGALFDDDGGSNTGAIYILSLCTKQVGSKGEHQFLSEKEITTEAEDFEMVFSGSTCYGDNCIRISPNPYSGSTTVTWDLTGLSNTSVEMYNVLGSKIQSYSPDQLASKQIHFSARELGYSAGIYLMKIKIGKQQYTYRLLELE